MAFAADGRRDINFHFDLVWRGIEIRSQLPHLCVSKTTPCLCRSRSCPGGKWLMWSVPCPQSRRAQGKGLWANLPVALGSLWQNIRRDTKKSVSASLTYKISTFLSDVHSLEPHPVPSSQVQHCACLGLLIRGGADVDSTCWAHEIQH